MSNLKKYKVINNFKDIHTGRWYTPKDEPISLSIDRIREINMTEKLIGYKLIEEVKTSSKKNK